MKKGMPYSEREARASFKSGNLNASPAQRLRVIYENAFLNKLSSIEKFVRSLAAWALPAGNSSFTNKRLVKEVYQGSACRNLSD